VPARRPDPQRVAAAISEQAAAIDAWLSTVDGSDWDKSTPLPDWSVKHLVLHLAQTLRTIAEAEPTGAAPMSVAEYLSQLPAAASEIKDRELANEEDPVSAYKEQLARIREIAQTATVQAPRGPLRLGEFLATRALELAVHTDDLARALPDNPPPAKRNATATAVRLLADLLATRAPGRSVEVRIPPYAAVQCVPGPRHTRGTPPTVIETDPVTWLRLGTGRIQWADALSNGAVNASGERSDLSVYLPLVS
jgi:uncharacterized protein (TIGR03083 family)